MLHQCNQPGTIAYLWSIKAGNIHSLIKSVISFAGCFIHSLNSLEISIWPNAKRNDNYDIYSCHSSDTYHNGLVTPYGDMGLHWLGSSLAQIMTYCLTAPIHSWTNIDFSLVRSCDSDLRAIHFFQSNGSHYYCNITMYSRQNKPENQQICGHTDVGMR